MIKRSGIWFKGKKYLLAGLLLMLSFSGCALQNDIVNTNKTNNTVKMTDGDFINQTAMHDAVRAKNLELVNELIVNGMMVDTADKYGYTPLHLAVRLDQYDIVKKLIESGASVNSTDKFGDTPLLDSSRNGSNNISQLLICNGAKKSVADKHNMNPLHNSSKNGDLYIAMLLQNDDMGKMCEDLTITLTSYDEIENKICGKIPTGVATQVSVTLSDETDDSIEPFGIYDAVIDKDSYCAQLDKQVKNSARYIVTAVATNGAQKDVAIANLDDLNSKYYIEGLYEALIKEFDKDFQIWDAELDKNGLVFRFKNPADLFTVGSSKISMNYKNILTQFYPRYLNVVFEYKDQIAQIRVEGHTSSEWKGAKNSEQRYAKNKRLSTKRAVNVFDFTMATETPILSKNLDWLRKNYKPYGLAYDYLIVDQDGIEDQDASRRVEFRINKLMK